MLLVSANKALRINKPKENIYGEIKITKNPTKFKLPKINRINQKRIKELEEEINKIHNGGWRGKEYDERIKPFKDEINSIQQNSNFSKEY